jgi:hypothetical protein
MISGCFWSLENSPWQRYKSAKSTKTCHFYYPVQDQNTNIFVTVLLQDFSVFLICYSISGLFEKHRYQCIQVPVIVL